MESLGHNLEVIDERLDGRLHALPVRQHDVGRVCLNGALGETLHCLLHDAQRLSHFFQPHQVPGVHITLRPGGHFKIKFIVARVGLVLSDIPVNS